MPRRPPPSPEVEASEYAFGDSCLNCGNPSSAAYCSKACEAQDATPSLVTNLDSSGGSVWSTPPSSNPVSPFFGAQSDSGHVQNLELDGKATGLHFDYGYHLDEAQEEAAHSLSRSSPSAPHLPSSEATITFPDLTAVNRRRSTGFDLQGIDFIRVRRTPQQMPSQPRRLSSNLLSPVLKPLTLTSPAVRPVDGTKSTQTTPTKKRAEHSACGKPQCPSLLCQDSDATHIGPRSLNMARRISAPLTNRLQRSASESDGSEPVEAPVRPVARGRSRAPKTRAPTAAEGAGRTTARPRAESAHLLNAAEAPICTKPDNCMATIKAKKEPTGKARGLRYLFGRAAPSPRAASPSTSLGLESHVSALDLGSPRHFADSAVVSCSSSSSSADEAPAEVKAHLSLLTQKLQSVAEPERGRGRVRSLATGADLQRSKSPHREAQRSSRSRQATVRPLQA